MPKKPKETSRQFKSDLEPIGKRIARIRKNKGFTQEELAKNMGITRTRLSKYEIDMIHLNDEMLIRLAQSLEVTTDELLGLKDHPSANKNK
jgi:transcriptional regulator with XRE-family HTH domain